MAELSTTKSPIPTLPLVGTSSTSPNGPPPIESAISIRSKKNEGYFIIPDNQNNLLRIFEYSSPIYASKKKSAKSLKTKLLIQVSLNDVESSILSSGINLIERYGEMKNVPIYYCNINLDLPFKETILPIAKSVLLGVIKEK